MKRILLILMMLSLSLALFSQDNETGDSKKNIDLDKIAEDIKSLDLDRNNDGRLRVGLELGMPITGITVGYHVAPKMEINVITGSLLDFESLGLGGSVLFDIVSLEAQDQIFPVTLGPVAYAVFNTDSIGFSAGGIARVEYDFPFPLNLYLQSGFIVNILKGDNDDPFNFPFALGVRYIF